MNSLDCEHKTEKNNNNSKKVARDIVDLGWSIG
jgi:hypothetical protein